MITRERAPGGAAAGVREPAASWHWRDAWLPLFAAYCLGFAVFGGYRYLTLNPELSRIAIRPDVPLHYPILTVHVLTGMVAISLAWVQVWPWLREQHPKIHRRSGWVFFLAGVFPSTFLAFPVAVLTPEGQGFRTVLLVMALLWTGTAVAGFRAVMQRRYDDHRRWMLRTVAMTTTIFTSRILAAIAIPVTLTLLPETYSTQQRFLTLEMGTAGLWGAIVIHLLFVEWYLLRPRRSRRPPGRRASKAAPAAVASG